MKTDPTILQPIHATQLARSHYENFPVASFWIPASKRDAIHAVYAFARCADDFADEPQYEGRRMELLQSWRACLEAQTHDCIAPELFDQLHKVMHAYELPVSLFHDLLDAFEQDVSVSKYPDLTSLHAYAAKSANPIGRLYLRIMGIENTKAFEWSDAICTALQFANFWQDVSVDLTKDRVYLPQDVMDQHGLSTEDLRRGIADQRYQDMLKELVQYTQELFESGKPLLNFVEGRFRIELKLIWLGGMKILDKIAGQSYKTLGRRPRLQAIDKCLLLPKALTL